MRIFAIYHTILFTFGSLVCLSLCVLGCAPASPEVSMELDCGDFKEQPAIDRDTEVVVGNSFTVTLGSTPTTGFAWSELAQISDESVIEQIDHKIEIGGIVGDSAQEVWTFKALKEGTSTIALEYSRPWESDGQYLWTFNLNVVVK